MVPTHLRTKNFFPFPTAQIVYTDLSLPSLSLTLSLSLSHTHTHYLSPFHHSLSDTHTDTLHALSLSLFSIQSSFERHLWPTKVLSPSENFLCLCLSLFLFISDVQLQFWISFQSLPTFVLIHQRQWALSISLVLLYLHFSKSVRNEKSFCFFFFLSSHTKSQQKC